jgi:ubiquinone/menaquinone biosynthesis C-methylase UbiE
VSLLDRTFAALYDPAMARAERGELGERRRQLLRDSAGHVADVGAGTGVVLDHLGPTVEKVTLIEPNPEMAARLRRRARRGLADADGREAAAKAVVDVREAPAEALPLPDDSVDTAVSMLVLCSVDDPMRALAEIRRVLRPGGRLALIEHVAAPGPTGWLQRALAPTWRVLARGCRLHRDTGSLLVAAGFDVSDVHAWRLPGGGPAAHAIAGIARPR